MTALPKIVVIVGPTASGKSALAMQVARAFDGEIVSADSRTIYRGMDIGTAKPTKEDRENVSHHLLDVVDPSETLTLVEYKEKALTAIQDVLKRGRLPVVVGGTGLYVSAIVDNLKIPEVEPNAAYRKELEALPKEELFAKLREADPEYAERIGPNPRYAIRALEVIKATGKTFSEQQGKGEQLFDALQIGLEIEKDELHERIDKRVDAMLGQGLLDEVKKIKESAPEDAPALSGIGYREFLGHLNGLGTLQDAVEMVKLHSRQYAKRQMTWFKRDDRIQWFKGNKAAFKAIENWLR